MTLPRQYRWPGNLRPWYLFPSSNSGAGYR